jgi:hypothetical protein
MKSNTRIEISLREHQLQPPRGLYVDEENPTLEELEEHEREVMEWHAEGGLDRHYLRLVVIIGPVYNWEGGGGHGLQRIAIESPRFPMDDENARASAKNLIQEALVAQLSHKLTSYPL